MQNLHTAEAAPGEHGKKEENEEEESGPLALWIALVYGTGLAINNVFLSQFGIYDFSLVKPKALFSGAVVLGSIALISAGPLFVIARFIDQRRQTAAHRHLQS